MSIPNGKAERALVVYPDNLNLQGAAIGCSSAFAVVKYIDEMGFLVFRLLLFCFCTYSLLRVEFSKVSENP